MYISPLSDIANRHNLSNHYYADDSQLYVSFTPGNNHRQTDAISQVGRCVDDVKSWMIKNSLKLNDSKTELMVFGTPHNLQLSSDIQLRVGDCVISPSEVVRDLGCFLDPTMSMISHVNNLCKSCYLQLRIIGHLRPYITEDVAKLLVHSLIITRLDYCNALLFGVSDELLQKLQRLQNMAARLITRVKRSSHITPSLIRLHWLPIRERILFKVLLLTRRAIRGTEPIYLCDLLHLYEPPRNLRSSAQSLLQCPKSRLKTFGYRAFQNSAPRLWNSIPLEMRVIESECDFKKALKTHLFRCSFNL